MRKGFSLVELMVVVAIIGILSTVAIPNFTKFRNRARQTNAKSELSGLFVAEKSFFAEYNGYHPYLNLIGFVPEGINTTTYAVQPNVMRYYATGFENETSTFTLTWPGVPNMPATNASWYGCSSAVTVLCSNGDFVNMTLLYGSTVTQAAFVATAGGCIANRSCTSFDRWTIDQNRVLRNTTSGL